MIAHCDFDLHFTDISVVEHLSTCLLGSCMFSFEKKVCPELLSIYQLGSFFFDAKFFVYFRH